MRARAGVLAAALVLAAPSAPAEEEFVGSERNIVPGAAAAGRAVVERYLRDHAADLEPAPILRTCGRRILEVPQGKIGVVDGNSDPSAMAATRSVASCVGVAISGDSSRAAVLHMDFRTNVEEALKLARGRFPVNDALTVRFYTTRAYHPMVLARALKYLSGIASVKIKEVSIGDRPELRPEDPKKQWISFGVDRAGGIHASEDCGASDEAVLALPIDPSRGN